jgi:hypothetical protein
MPSLQDGEVFSGMVSTGFTRGYYHPAPPGQGACGVADARGARAGSPAFADADVGSPEMPLIVI